MHGYAVGLSGSILKYKGTITNVREPIEVVSGFSLKQNYPNPFNPSTTISFFIAEKTYVILKIYNLIGSEIKSIEQPMGKGEHIIKFTSDHLPSGVYIYTLSADKYRASKKMMIIK